MTLGRFCCQLCRQATGWLSWRLRHQTAHSGSFPSGRRHHQPLGHTALPISSYFFAVPSPMFMAFGRGPLSSTVRMLPALVLLIVFGFETLAANAIFKRSMQFFYRMREKASRAGGSFFIIMVIRCAAPAGNSKSPYPSSRSLDMGFSYFLTARHSER